MPSSSKSKKRASEDTASSLNKKQSTGNTRESLVWVDISNKTSWVWKHFKLATDGRTYCFYTETIDDIEKICDFSCAYNSQTSSTKAVYQMELRDILLCVEQIKYPHTSDHIRETIKNKLEEFNLIDKITTVITDNEAQAELNAKFGEKYDSQNQLSNENQNEMLEECANKMGSTLASWQRLKKLKPAIKRVLLNLSIETDYQNATEFLGDQKYCTISLIYPTIQALKFSYAPDNNDNNKNDDDEEENSENGDNEDNNKSNNEDDDDERKGLKEKTTTLLRSEYKKERQEDLKETNTETNSQSKQTFASRVFGLPQSQIPIYEEFSYYLDEIKTP
ncbi:hypothetical protein C1645_826197 [Glomus cerebriforme]|uniref:Uncharacterized protein n=1 Tax=Glomus cerebriforme TaxID=658196 RepID=A0A397SVA0_9GLOM|nr:hypothetical protein C1645_826197 [Glomus cerebriforme]